MRAHSAGAGPHHAAPFAAAHAAADRLRALRAALAPRWAAVAGALLSALAVALAGAAAVPLWAWLTQD
jgi:hypothetical protein